MHVKIGRTCLIIINNLIFLLSRKSYKRPEPGNKNDNVKSLGVTNIKAFKLGAKSSPVKSEEISARNF